MKNQKKSLHHGHRFSAGVISFPMRWYFRFQCRLRYIEKLGFERRGHDVRDDPLRRRKIRLSSERAGDADRGVDGDLLAEDGTQADRKAIPGAGYTPSSTTSTPGIAWDARKARIPMAILPAPRRSNGTCTAPYRARYRIEAAWDCLDAHIADARAWIAGDRLSTVDLLAIMLMCWLRNMSRKATAWPCLEPYISRLRALLSFVELNAREGLTHWSNPTS
jgi:hypothetical protein